MSQAEFITSETVDLTNCDREPIHIPGLIQAHGILLVLQEPEFEILQVSQNTFDFIGRHPQQLLNQKLESLVGDEQVNAIKECLTSNFESVNPLRITIKNQEDNSVFDGITHRLNGFVILELEPAKVEEDVNFFKFYHLVRNSVTKLQKAPNLLSMCQAVVNEVQKLTGFERVMVYKFDESGAGSVIAEKAREELTPYLGLHYPPSDIPKQAKQLYTLNWLRIIPDVNYQPQEIIPVNNPLTNSPVDLSFSVLRSVSPIHIEYLKNMSVTASMSISLIQDKKLWGLIACHDSSPKYVGYTIRTACEFLGQVMSLELANKESNEDLDYKMSLKSIQSEFVKSISQENSLLDGLVKSELNLLDIVSATGAVVTLGDKLTIVGSVPYSDDLHELLAWVEEQSQDNIFHTNSLPKLYPKAEKYKDVASGLLALTISRIHKNYILWFRPEVIRTVNWGGNPTKPVEVDDNGNKRIYPRKSFSLWQETVRSTSLPWKSCEIEAVAELRSAVVGIVLRKADELAKINLELERSNNELDAFAYIASHDLKEPLRGIHNYSSFLMEDFAHVLNEDGVSKLQTLVRLTQRMEDLINSLLHFSRLGRAELSMQRTNLNVLLENAIDVIKISQKDKAIDIRIPRELPTISCDRVQLNELFTNLIINGIKYNNKSEKLIEVGFLDREEAAKQLGEHANSQAFITFYVKDNGIGIPQRHYENIFRIFKRLHGQNQYGGGTGAGLTIARKIVERHGGRIWVESTVSQGSTFYFTLPK